MPKGVYVHQLRGRKPRVKKPRIPKAGKHPRIHSSVHSKKTTAQPKGVASTKVTPGATQPKAGPVTPPSPGAPNVGV